RYPVSFNGKERIVTVSGEAYFEVASMMDGATSSKVPFIVEIASDAGKIAGRVEVLGTHFNVNSYSDEDNIKTTLVEGKVRVVAAYSDQPAELSPGEQAVMSRPQQGKSQELYKVKAKVDQVIAWKDGVFDFQDASLREVMRQLARWYDLEVVYENDPEMYFVGKMSRKMRLPNLLKALDKSGVKFRLEDNRKLIVQ
ncbi:MAG TPA: FecR domain-containing protein, partial [Parasegetibacter sp.]